MHHFFANRISDSEATLDAKDSHHLLRVLRKAPGDQVSISFNDGQVYLAEIEELDKKNTRLQLLKLLREQAKPGLIIALAPTKSSDRFEFFLEKATELGVAKIIPLHCHHSERKQYKLERGQRVIEAAAKQSQKGYLPELQPMISLGQCLKDLESVPCYMAHLNLGKRLPLHDLDLRKPVCILIGPEGDFSPEEVDLAQSAGVHGLDMGREVLRTETAGITAAAAAALQRHGLGPKP